MAGLLGLTETEAAPCPKGKKRCRRRCIPQRHCCTNANCPKGSGKVCRRGRCVCPPNTKACGRQCIPRAACCGGCSAEQVCRQATCCLGTTEALLAALGPGGPATIQLCPGTTYPGSFTIERDVTIIGAGAASTILDLAGGFGTVVTIAAGVTVELQHLQITRGVNEQGAGIHNRGTLTLRGCLITENRATQTGGIHNRAGTVTLLDSAVTNNDSTISGGGIGNDSGTVIMLGTSRVAGNETRGAGGGIFLHTASSRVELHDDSIVTDNTAESGGGIATSTQPEFAGTVVFFGRSRVIGNRPNDCTGVQC